jgi:hypothetical protein
MNINYSLNFFDKLTKLRKKNVRYEFLTAVAM